MIRKTICSIIFSIFALSSYATHLIGGDINYSYLGISPSGDIRYKISVSLLRDCTEDVLLGNTISIGIYLDQMPRSLYKVQTLSLTTKFHDNSSTDCYEGIGSKVCIEMGYYEGIVSLHPSSQNYILSYESCCRNSSSNLAEGDFPQQSFFLTCTIPQTSINSSSSYYEEYIVIAPLNTKKIISIPISQEDGDSLVFEHIIPYASEHANTGDPNPDPRNVLSENIGVRYRSGFSLNAPFGSAGSYISKEDGYFELLIENAGSYYISFLESTFRNDNLLIIRNIDILVYAMEMPEQSISEYNSPTSFKLRKSTSNKPLLSWKNCPNKILRYEIFRKASNERSFKLIDSTSKGTLDYLDNSEDLIGEYEYYVKGIPEIGSTSGNTDTLTIGVYSLGVQNAQLGYKGTIYPNPASNFLTIESSIPVTSIHIKSLDGRLISSIKDLNLKRHSLDISHLKSGLYYLEVKDTSGYYVSKLLVE